MMQQMTLVVYFVALVASLLSERSEGFTPQRSLAKRNQQSQPSRTTRGTMALPAYATTGRKQTTTDNNDNSNEKTSFWLKDFSIASGEVIDPYAVLKVARKADGSLIRQSYIEQSRRYHPDGARHRKLLPGSCNSIEEVRDQWERIKLAYEILYVDGNVVFFFRLDWIILADFISLINNVILFALKK
jgi:DnaJ-domain-containing protein 1